MDLISEMFARPALGTLSTGKPNLFSVSYDLRLMGQNYDGLISQIEKMGGIRVQQSMWLVTSYASTSAYLRDQLLQFIDYNDSILVTRLVDIAGWEGDPKVRMWIESVISASILIAV